MKKHYYDIGVEVERTQYAVVTVRVRGASGPEEAEDAAKAALQTYFDHIKDTKGGFLSLFGQKDDPLLQRFRAVIRRLDTLWKAPRGWAQRLKVGKYAMSELAGEHPAIEIDVASEEDQHEHT